MHTAPGLKGIELLCQGLADGPCLAPIEHDWEDVGPIEVHLSVCMWELQCVILEEQEALPCVPDVLQNFGLASSIMWDQRPEVDKLVHQVDVFCCHLDYRLGQKRFPEVLDLLAQ